VKIHPVGAELYHADERTVKSDKKTNGGVLNFKNALKKELYENELTGDEIADTRKFLPQVKEFFIHLYKTRSGFDSLWCH
jgi:hypothetical protein